MITFCPHCEAMCDGHDEITGSGATPKEGDVSICESCVRSFVFTADGDGRAPTLAELARITADPRVMITKAMIKASRQ